MITRENYEIYAINFWDGNLSPEEQRAFKLFLEKNPDLKEEFEQMSSASNITTVNELKFPHSEKQQLKKVSPINIDTEDQFLIDELESSITEENAKYLHLYIEEYPEKGKKRAWYQKTKLVANETIVFADKSSLKKSLLLVYVNKFYPIGIAASVLLIWMYSFFFQSPKKQVYTARVEHPEELILEKHHQDLLSSTEKPFVTSKNPSYTKSIKEKKSKLRETKLELYPEKMPLQNVSMTAALRQDIVPIPDRVFTYHKPEPVVIVVEENISLGNYLSQVLKREKNKIQEKAKDDFTWNDVLAWVGKTTGIHISQKYELGEPGLEIAMGNNIEIEKK